MLLVKTYLDKSKIHGIGLFAGQFISMGTIVQRVIPGFDLMIQGGGSQKAFSVAKKMVL